MHLDVSCILEHVFAVALQSININVMAEHEWIGAAVHLQVLYAYVVATPEHLVGIVHRYVLQFEMAHLAKHLRRVDNRVAHLQMVAIPQG